MLLVFRRSPALRNFATKLGYANHRLNTIIVGLEGVRTGTVVKPPDLAVRWGPKDLVAAAAEARGFTTKSILVYAVDALDQYMADLARHPSPIFHTDVADHIRANAHVAKVIPTKASTIRWATKLSEASSDPAMTLIVIRDLFFSHFKKRHIRTRFAQLIRTFPVVPEYYSAAVHLLVSWRNRHVHDSPEVESEANLRRMLDAAEYFQVEHAGINISRAIDNYRSNGAPTLKEVSTLISVLHRVVQKLDQEIRKSADVEALACRSISAYLGETPNSDALIKKHWGRDVRTRIRKLERLLEPYGFISQEEPGEDPFLHESFLEELAKLSREEFEDKMYNHNGRLLGTY